MPVFLLTRPEDAARGFARQMADEFGPVQVMIAPLTGIEWADDAPDLHGIQALVFTSRNGVLAYQRLDMPKGMRAYCVGEATSRAASQVGLEAISADGDAAALIALIAAAGQCGPILHIRGAETRGAVAHRLNQAGIETFETVLYRQVTLPLPTEARTLLQGNLPVIVPLFSPRSAARFAAYAPFDAPLFLAAISPAAAERLHGLETRAIVTADRPDAMSMLYAVEGLKDAATRLEAGGDAK